MLYTIYGNLIDYHPRPIIILAFVFQDTKLLQCRKITFYCALAHRQDLRHLFAGDCRRFFDKIEDFLLMLRELRLRYISVMVSDIRGVGRGKDDCFKPRITRIFLVTQISQITRIILNHDSHEYFNSSILQFYFDLGSCGLTRIFSVNSKLFSQANSRIRLASKNLRLSA